MSFSKCSLCENQFVVSTDIITCSYKRCKTNTRICDTCFKKLESMYKKNASDENMKIFSDSNCLDVMCLNCGKFSCSDHHSRGICFDCHYKNVPPCTCNRCSNCSKKINFYNCDLKPFCYNCHINSVPKCSCRVKRDKSKRIPISCKFHEKNTTMNIIEKTGMRGANDILSKHNSRFRKGKISQNESIMKKPIISMKKKSPIKNNAQNRVSNNMKRLK